MTTARRAIGAGKYSRGILRRHRDFGIANVGLFHDLLVAKVPTFQQLLEKTDRSSFRHSV